MNTPRTTTEDEASVSQQETLDLEAICQKVKDHLEISSQTSVMDLAEKIDKLVNKLINLEFTVSSHNAQLHSLRSEIYNIHKHIHSLEERKVSFSNVPTSPSDSLKQLKAELHKMHSFEKQPIRTDLADTCHSLGDNAEKSQSPKLENQVKSDSSSPFQEDSSFRNMEPQKENKKTHTTKIHKMKDNVEEKTSFCPKDLENQVQPEPIKQLANGTVKSQEEEQEDEIRGKDMPKLNNNNHFGSDHEHKDATPNLL